LVDEEAQEVLAYAVFVRRPGLATPRNVFAEWFIIEEEKIRIVYVAMFYPPPDLAVPNWPPYDGNWPLPGSIMPAERRRNKGDAWDRGILQVCCYPSRGGDTCIILYSEPGGSS